MHFAIDRFSERQMYATSYRQWLQNNRLWMQDYFDKNVEQGILMTEHMAQERMFMQKPYLGYSVVRDWMTSNEQKVEDLMDFIVDTPGALLLIIGQVGQGKTVLLFWLAEMLHNFRKKKIAMLQTTLKLPPEASFIRQYESIHEIPSSYIVLYDEASLSMNARDAMTTESKDMSGLLAIRRHQDYTILAATQHHSIADVNLMRAAQGFLFKRVSWEELNRKSESSAFDMLREFIRRMLPRSPEETLFSDGESWFKMRTGLPTFWSERISKSYSRFTSEEAVEYIVNSMEQGVKPKQIVKMLKLRGFATIGRTPLTLADIRQAYEEPDYCIETWSKRRKEE